MEAREKYAADFEKIVNLVWNVYNKKTVHPSSSHLVKLKEELLSSQQRYWTTFTIEKEDIEQELNLLWIYYSSIFGKKKRQHSFRTFLLECSVFGIRTWFNRQVSVPMRGAQAPLIIQYQIQEFELDLKFLVDGTDYWPLCNLTPYERYLIFLRFKEEKSIIEIAYVVQKNRELVSKQLRRTLNRLRREINES